MTRSHSQPASGTTCLALTIMTRRGSPRRMKIGATDTHGCFLIETLSVCIRVHPCLPCTSVYFRVLPWLHFHAKYLSVSHSRLRLLAFDAIQWQKPGTRDNQQFPLRTICRIIWDNQNGPILTTQCINFQSLDCINLYKLMTYGRSANY